MRPSRRQVRLSKLAFALTLSGCNAVLGIDAPQAPSREGMAGDQGFGTRVDGGSETSGNGGQPAHDGGSTTPAIQLPADPHPWAQWPMPNPASSNLGTPSSYSLATPGIVNDDVTGLAWQQAVGVEVRTWQDARDYCANLALAGGGFRMPSRIELLSLIDYTQTTAALDAVAFPSAPAAEFWTASPFAGSESSVWTVNFSFGTGFVFSSEIEQKHLVRCVR
jgi:hypothetical protein